MPAHPSWYSFRVSAERRLTYFSGPETFGSREHGAESKGREVPPRAGDINPGDRDTRGKRYDRRLEEAERTQDRRYGEALLEGLNEWDGKPNGSLEKVIEAADRRSALIALLQLIVAIIHDGQQQVLASDVTEGDSGRAARTITELRDGTAIVRTGDEIRLRLPGSTYLEDGTLAPENRASEGRGEQRRRLVRLSADLASGATIEDVRTREQGVVDKSDEVIDRPDAGKAARETAERKRLEAERDLQSLGLLQTERQTFVAEMNRRYSFEEAVRRQQALRPDLATVLAPFRHARFELDQHLRVVLRGIDPSVVRSLESLKVPGKRGDYFVEAEGDGFVVGKEGTFELQFLPSDNGSVYVMDGHRGFVPEGYGAETIDSHE